MNHERLKFRFTLAAMFYATLLAAACVAMFTWPIGENAGAFMAARVIAGFAFGGAAIGSLFGHAGDGAWAGAGALIIGGILWF